MHLSLLSDCYLSDSLRDVSHGAAGETAALAHRHGLLRGLAVMGVAGVLLGLTAMSTTFRSAAADTAVCGTPSWQALADTRTQASAPAQAAVWWEANDPFHRSAEAVRRSTTLGQTGTAVSPVALRQRFRSACR